MKYAWCVIKVSTGQWEDTGRPVPQNVHWSLANRYFTLMFVFFQISTRARNLNQHFRPWNGRDTLHHYTDREYTAYCNSAVIKLTLSRNLSVNNSWTWTFSETDTPITCSAADDICLKFFTEVVPLINLAQLTSDITWFRLVHLFPTGVSRSWNQKTTDDEEHAGKPVCRRRSRWVPYAHVSALFSSTAAAAAIDAV